jgi:hypothetical protein
MTTWIKTNGTQTGELGLGFTGPRIKNDAGNLAVKSTDDNSHVAVKAANVVVINDTTGFTVDLQASPDQLANYSFVLPPNVGVSGQFLQTAGNGRYTWETAVLPGELATETFLSIAGQTGFTLAYSPTGDVSVSINGAVISNLAAQVAGTLLTYDPAENAGYVLEADDAITVTYIYGTVAAGDLNSLSDVDVITPTNGSALVYNAVTGKWVVGAGITDPTSLTNGASNVAIPSASGNVSISVSGVANILTITTAGGNVTGNLDITNTLTAVNANISGNVVAGNILVPPNGTTDTFDLRVSNEAIITGNLNVLGNLNTTDTNTFTVVGPIFEFGGIDPNNAPLSINDGMDRGMILDYYNGSFKQSFFGWDNANGQFEAGAEVSNANNVINTARFANIKAHTFIGNVEGGNITGNIIGNVTGNLINGTSNIVIPTPGGDILFAAGGNSQMTIAPTGVDVAGNISIGNSAAIAGNITVAGQTNLGVVANVHITGGSNGQILMTNGAGNLTWANLSANALYNGNSNVIVLANGVVNISSNGVANVLSVSEAAANIDGNLAVTGVTRLNVIGNVKINGGANGQAIITDGAGNLSFATPIVSNLNNGTSNVVVAANGNVTTSVGGVANVFTVTATGANVIGTANVTGNLSAANIITGNAAVAANLTVGRDANISGNVVVTGALEVGDNADFLSSITVGANANIAGKLNITAVTNLYIPGGTTGQTLITDGTGNLSWGAGSGGGGGGNITIRDEGIELTNATSILNFTGAGVSAGILGNVVTINVPGAGASQPTIEFVAPIDGIGQIFNDPAIANLTSNTQCSVYVNGVLSRSTDFTVSGTALTFTRQLVAGDEITAAPVTVFTSVPQSAISSGTSAVTVTANGNVGISAAGTADVVAVSGTGAAVTGNLEVSGDLAVAGNVTIATDISVAGKAVFSDVANVSILGGSAGRVLSTDGTGNLSWVTPAAGGGATVVPVPTMEFVVAANGAGQTFTNANIANILSNAQCSTYVNGALVTVADFSIAGSVMTVGRYLRTNDVVSIAPFGVTNMAVTGAGGATTQLQFNDAGNLRGITTATYDGNALTLGSNAQVKITGGTVGQSLVTDGTGNLSWSSTASAAGLDTELQYNNAGASAGIPTATYDGTVLTLGAVDEVSITGGTPGQALITDGAGVLSFGQAMLPGWTNAGPVIIGAVTTAPTKGTPAVDFVRYRKVAPREYHVQMMYSQTTAGSDGSGAYLFTLPAGLQFDFTSPGQRMTPGLLSNSVAPTAVTLGLPGGPAGIVNISTGGTVGFVAQVIIIPYSATQFRVFTASALSTVGTLTPVGADTYRLSDATVGYNWNFSFIATA